MTHPKPNFLKMDGERILELYSRHFPEWPYGTPEAQQVLSFALELAVTSFNQGLDTGRSLGRRTTKAAA